DEAVEARALVLRPLGLDVQHHLLAGLGQARQGARAAAHDVADAAHVHERLVLAHLRQDSAQASDHAALPIRRTARAWAWVMATARASAASAFGSPAVGRRGFTMKATWALSPPPVPT